MTYNQLDAYNTLGFITDGFSHQHDIEYPSREQSMYTEYDNYASTSSWAHEVNVKQESAPPMTLQLPFHQAPFHAEHVEYDVYNQSTWPQEFPIHAPAQFGADMGVASECWSPYTESLTPDLQYSSPALSDGNVFDMSFGQHAHEHAHSHSHSPTPSLSPEPVTPPAKRSTPVDDDSSRRRHPCLIPGCLRRFTSQYTLKVHMQAHKPKPRVTFLCTLGCGERFSRQHDRLRHEVAKHNKVCEFSCEACGRFFSTAKTLGNHKCPLAQGGTRWVHH